MALARGIPPPYKNKGLVPLGCIVLPLEVDKILFEVLCEATSLCSSIKSTDLFYYMRVNNVLSSVRPVLNEWRCPCWLRCFAFVHILCALLKEFIKLVISIFNLEVFFASLYTSH